jgi:hypothetical protein
MVRNLGNLRKGEGMNTQAKSRALEALMRLKQHNVDALGLRVWLEKKTRMGKKAHPKDVFGFTRGFLSTYSEDTEVDDVISVLTSEGLKSDHDTLRYLLVWDELIPDFEED